MGPIIHSAFGKNEYLTAIWMLLIGPKNRPTNSSRSSRNDELEQFRRHVRAMAEQLLNFKNVGSAERLARTTARQPLTNGTRISNQTPTRWSHVLGQGHWSGPTLLSGPGWLRVLGTLSLAWTWRCWVRPMSRLD